VRETSTATEGAPDLEVEFTFACDDGSGEFSMSVDVPSEVVADGETFDRTVATAEMWEDAAWAIATSAGSYTDLEGDGMRSWTVLEAGVAPADGGGVRNVFVGTVRSG
jgi:hypothetical protein